MIIPAVPASYAIPAAENQGTLSEWAAERPTNHLSLGPAINPSSGVDCRSPSSVLRQTKDLLGSACHLPRELYSAPPSCGMGPADWLTNLCSRAAPLIRGGLSILKNSGQLLEFDRCLARDFVFAL